MLYYEGRRDGIDGQVFLLPFRDTEKKYDDAVERYADVLREIDSRIEVEEANGSKSELKNLRHKLVSRMKNLTVWSFNGSNYDLAVIKAYLFTIIRKYDRVEFVIKKMNSYIQIRTSRLNFLDIVHFLGPRTSYRKFIEESGVEQRKGFFPYSYMTDLEKLKETKLPEKRFFYNDLTKSDISDENYLSCAEAWDRHSMRNLADYLAFYNLLDVTPLVQAIELQFDYYRSHGVRFDESVSLPGLSFKLLMKMKEPRSFFCLFGRTFKDVFKLVKRSLVGGQSIVLCRKAVVGESFIRANVYKERAKLCRRFTSFDCSAMYLRSFSREMPTGFFVH